MDVPLRVLYGYGFPPLFISWIMECVSITSFSVALNGSLHGLFPGKKGLRQRDPMLPALFFLCMEYFSRLIKRNTSISDFNFHPNCEKLKITHLLFADDLMLFHRGDLPSIHILIECHQEFRDVSGLAVNTTKSNIFTAGIQDDILDEVLAMTEFARGHMPVRAFLWNFKRAQVAWEEICHPKEEGDLGIQHIQSWNVALLARVLWSIHCKADTLWAKWVNEVYLRGASLWEWQPKKGDSPLLRRLAEIRDRIITDFGSTDAAIQHMAEWTDSKGLITSKAYEYFRPKLPRQPWKASIWKAFIPPKYSFIMWLGLWEMLATRDRLAFLHEDPSCSLCISSKESTKYLFFECPFSAYVWSHIRQWFGITRRMSTLLSAVKWLKKGKTGSSVHNKARHLALACTVYNLWRHRNKIIFEGKAPNPDGLVISIKITVYRLILTLFPHGF
ncbi:hypothetical protein Sango_1274000 [Sesamum angolense]|uniref:Reverse transcriptase domain-containing protein n=1 Tax=Sesamum angolense TaxID=2727404 RepID=A0AAE2BUG9_9LAMI|nr:hypothetical protein Sango_1274000 [Sesamum angolense]